MRFLIIGATGPCGILLIQNVLKAYPEATIVVYARSPNKIPEVLQNNPALQIIKGELNDRDAFDPALEGVDVVLSALGPTVGHSGGTPLAKGYEVLIDLMHKHGVRRLIALGTPSVDDPLDKLTWKFSSLIWGVRAFAHTAYTDIRAIAETIRTRGEDLDWTITRVPVLLNGDSEVVYAGYMGDPQVGTMLNRKGYAAFVVDEVGKREWIHKRPLLSSP